VSPRWVRDPRESLACDRLGHFVSARKFAKGDVVAAFLESGHDAAAATVDWKDGIVGAMRYEEARAAVWRPFDDKPGRKGDDSREQVTIDQSERQRVRGAVRESSNRDPVWIDSHRLEHTLEGAVDEVDVRAKASAHCIPRRLARIGGEHGYPRFVWRRPQAAQNSLTASGRAMQQNKKRQRLVRGLPRHAKNRIAVSVEPQRSFGPADVTTFGRGRAVSRPSLG